MPTDTKGSINYNRYHGELHRDDGPAVINSTGTKKWYYHGKLYRDDGPAIIFSNGMKEWMYHGELHRDDGPAIIYSDGDKEWFLYGKKISKEFHKKLTQGPVEDLPLYLGMGFDVFIEKRLKNNG